jgi:geranylgeranyl pyrophosphate synthase
VWSLPEKLNLTGEVEGVNLLLREWADQCDPEVDAMIRRQLGARAKYFRPVTTLACARATNDQFPDGLVMRAAAAVEFLHNVTLIIDDILDRSRYRRGELSLHCRYGSLPALMVSGYITAAATSLVADDRYTVQLLSELMQRLGVAECYQWRLRRRPLGVEDWRIIAGKDTGTMFEICARLGSRDGSLERFGLLLGVLYHGCDDVADIRGATALGGGSESDILDGILTLPAAVAIRDPGTAALFEAGQRESIGVLTERLSAAIPEAERELDKIAHEASTAARTAPHPGRLLELVEYTRALSDAE